MAANCSTSNFLAILFIFAAANAAYGRQYNISLTGRVCCTPTGRCPGQGAANAIAKLVCPNPSNGSTIILGHGTTNSTGHLTINTTCELSNPYSLLSCRVMVPLSGGVCPESDSKQQRNRDGNDDGLLDMPIFKLIIGVILKLFFGDKDE